LNGSITEAITEAADFLSLDTEVLVRDGHQNGGKNIDRFLDEAVLDSGRMWWKFI
jgi:DNA helicase-2/ATP-dependent DNA helicase PcrA